MGASGVKIILLEWFDYSTVTEVGRSIFLGFSHVPIPRGGAQHPQFFETPYLCAKGLTYSDEIRYGLAGQERVSRGGGSHAPLPRGVGPQCSKKIWNTLHRRKRFDLQTTKFGRVTYVGSGVFLGVSHAPSLCGRAPVYPKFWDVLHAHSQYEKQPNLHGN